MQHIDLDKKRPARWPWLAGAVVLALALWGVTLLLRAPAEPEDPAVGITAADTLPPATIPMAEPEDFGSAPLPRLDEVVPLEDDDLGAAVRLQGEVVATGNRSFWIVADSFVLRIESARRTRRGDTVSVRGTLLEADAAVTRRIADQVMSRHPDFGRWTIIEPFKLVEETGDGVAAATEAG